MLAYYAPGPTLNTYTNEQEHNATHYLSPQYSGSRGRRDRSRSLSEDSLGYMRPHLKKLL